ncbi:MAG: TPM domain-containing protein [Tissierellia bacterium]|nr:TPM domain-containing protein [Tissierellia bacterium]
MMRKMFVTVLVILLLIPLVALAESSDSKQLVYDQANLFSQDEVKELEDSIREMNNDHNMDIILMTTNDAEGKSARDYADDFYEGIYGIDHDGAIFSIDMDNRELRVSASGITIDYLTDGRQQEILDSVYDKASEGDFYGAANAYISSTKRFLEAGIPAGQHRVEEKSLKPIEMLVSAVVGALSGLISFAGVKKSYNKKPTGRVFDYAQNAITTGLIASDSEVSSRVIRNVITSSSSGSSGGSSTRSTTYRSSGGGTRSSSGRKF